MGILDGLFGSKKGKSLDELIEESKLTVVLSHPGESYLAVQVAGSAHSEEEAGKRFIEHAKKQGVVYIMKPTEPHRKPSPSGVLYTFKSAGYKLREAPAPAA